MKSPQGQFIDSSSEEKLKTLGFEKITEIGHPFEKLSCGYRSVNNLTGIHLFPIFEASGDNHLYFDYCGGRMKIESVDQLRKLIVAMKNHN